jgi:aspartate aminotransferase
MPKISERGNRMPESPIRKLVPYAEEARRKGRTIYYLNIGQPDIPTPEIVLNAIRNNDLKIIEYSHSAGIESYRKKLAKYYQNLGIHISHNEILITTGGSEAILFGMMSCFNPGEEIIISEPYYANYNGFAIIAGAKIKPVTASIENGFALPPIEEFERLITPKTKGIIICNPNNPTGYLYSRDELLKLKEIIKKYDLYLFSDEVYREFCYDGLVHVSAMHLEGIDEQIIMMDSVSKRYSSCGARIGALVTKNKDIINTALKFAQARLSPPSFGQIAAEAALDTTPEYFRDVYQEYIERRNFMVKTLNKMEGVICPLPKGAFYTITHLPVDDTEKFSKWLLSDFEYNNATVLLAPASGFYATPGLGKQEVRIAYVLKIENLKKAMKCLEEALNVYPGKIM